MRAKLVESVFEPKTLEGVEKEVYEAMDDLKNLGFNVYNFTRYENINVPGLFAFSADSAAVFNYHLHFTYRTQEYIEFAKTTKQKHRNDKMLGWQGDWNKANQYTKPAPTETMFALKWDKLLPEVLKSILVFDVKLDEREHKLNNEIKSLEQHLKELKQDLHHIKSIKR